MKRKIHSKSTCFPIIVWDTNQKIVNVPLALSLLCLSACSGNHKIKDNSQRPEKPNIIILMTDDQGYGDVHCYNNAELSTPNLDKMANEGVRFTNFYAGASSSTPSRAALLTGRYAQRVGLPTVVDDTTSNGLKSTEYTIADYLKQNNYATGIFGKWHLGCQPEHMPTRHGFTEFFGIPYSNDMWPFHPKPSHPYKALPLYENETVVEYNPNVNTITARLTEHAVNFINRHSKEAFFMYVPYTLPHVPLGVSDKFKGKSGQGIYADVIMEIDWSVGEILKALQDNGIDEHTLVMFTSDNGPWLTYGNHSGWNGGLREGKGTTFEGGQRVPFIIRMPGTIPANQVSNQFISALDITPTLLQLTQTKMPHMNPFDGQNIWDAFLCKPITHQPFFFVNNEKVEAVRADQWKLILLHKYRIVIESGKNGRPGIQNNYGAEIGLSLFDLVKDPQETVNLAEEHQAIAAKLYQLADSFQVSLLNN